MRQFILLLKGVFTLFLFSLLSVLGRSQPLHNAWSASSLTFDRAIDLPELTGFDGIKWEEEGHLFTRLIREKGGYKIVEYDPADKFSEKILAESAQLIPANRSTPLSVADYKWYPQEKKLLVFTNTKRVWRARTRGDYWVFDAKEQRLWQLGRGLPEASLQFAKISPDGEKAAYVSKHNIYIENLQTGKRKMLTTDGTEKIINGTFDWVYEEELFCRDGFRWSPDSKSIAYWQIDASDIRDYLMLNTTDSIYSFVIPVQYPKVGYDPSSAKIGVVDISTAATDWMDIPGNPVEHYLPRMEWAGNSKELMVQQFNRKQDTCNLWLIDTKTGHATKVYTESDAAWLDINYFWQYDRPGWDWINDGKAFLWRTGKDGWRHVYRISRDGSKEQLITKGNYDVIDIAGIDRKNDLLYFYASPENTKIRRAHV